MSPLTTDLEPMPAWAAMQMSETARWAGHWAGCSDILAMLVRRLPDDEDTRAALRGYEALKADYEHPKMFVNAPASQDSS